MTIGQYWLGRTKPKQDFRLNWNAFKKLLQNFKKIYLTEFSTDWLTNSPTICLTAWYLQTRVTWQWLRAWFFHCLTPLQPEKCPLPYTAVHAMHSSQTYHSRRVSIDLLWFNVMHYSYYSIYYDLCFSWKLMHVIFLVFLLLLAWFRVFREQFALIS